MRKTIKIWIIALLTGYLGGLVIGCGPTIVVKEPPPKKVEVRPARPYSNAGAGIMYGFPAIGPKQNRGEHGFPATGRNDRADMCG